MYDLRPLVKGSLVPSSMGSPLGVPSLGTSALASTVASVSVGKAVATAIQDAVSSCPTSHLPGKGLAAVRRTSSSSRLEDGRLHLTLGPMSADHKSSTQDLAHTLWPRSLFWETFFYFFFFYWKMSLWGNECQLVYIKIVNCLKNILW